MSSNVPELFGWPVSPYTAKTRAHLRCKNVPFKDTVPTLPTMVLRIKRKVGRVIMPTLRLPDGTWLQDTSDLFDWIEERYAEPSFVPDGPSQRLASHLLELFGDESLPMYALHYRWNNETNAKFAIEEFGRYALPYVPRFLRSRLVASTAAKLKGYLGPLGVNESTIPAIEETAKRLIATLNNHFEQHSYLFGDRPSLGDFSLYGPLWAHLYRDPGTQQMFDDAPHLVRWFERLQTNNQTFGEFLADDVVPATLNPLWELVFGDQWSWVSTLIEHIDTYCKENPEERRVPRALGTAPFTFQGREGERKLITFVQWKAQRPLDVYESMSLPDRARVNAWLDTVGGQRFKSLRVNHPFVRENFKCVLASQR